MKAIDLVVVDIGNSACKVGVVRAEELLQVHIYGLEECAHQPWRHRAVSELAEKNPRWTLSGSNPPIINSFAGWLRKEEQSLAIIDSQTPLPLEIKVDAPDRVGRDRLLNAIAVEQKPAIIISAGSAVTVDLVDAQGRFQGGAIFPGLRLMARSLHEYTAKLPLIDASQPNPTLPGKNTEQAMHAGIVQAVLGGITGCANEMKGTQDEVAIYLTGGDAVSLQPLLPWPVPSVPTLALQGMIIVSRTLWA